MAARGRPDGPGLHRVVANPLTENRIGPDMRVVSRARELAAEWYTVVLLDLSLRRVAETRRGRGIRPVAGRSRRVAGRTWT